MQLIQKISDEFFLFSDFKAKEPSALKPNGTFSIPSLENIFILFIDRY